MTWVQSFHDIGLTDVSSVGGKNASLGVMGLGNVKLTVPFCRTVEEGRHSLLKTMVAIVEAEEAIAERRPEARPSLPVSLEPNPSTKQPVGTGANQ
jgi:phosphoenolpyruvate synthase/pyruvate phosphate dikinase